MTHAIQYEPAMGLEVHSELATASKVFCACSTQFAAPPNTQVCPVCLGLPGSLPVLSRAAVDYALQVALALNCRINIPCLFERKNYYYPDLPKNYQISQKRAPLGMSGWIDIEVNGRVKRASIADVHLEEDTGKLIHPQAGPALSGAEGNDYSLVDFNRSGVPLLEIVGGETPDLTTLDEVSAFMTGIRQLLLYLGVSRARMEAGELRFEANISLRPKGSSELGDRVEVKNLNSFRSVLRALEHEMIRQEKLLREGRRVARETRLWDEPRGVTAAMRSKEEAQDYRYFPEPDLVPLAVDEQWLDRLRASLPELPRSRRLRFVEQYGLADYDAAVLTSDRALADFFEEAVRLGADPKAAGNWAMGDLLGLLRDRGIELADARIRPEHLAQMLKLMDQATISSRIAKAVFQEMFDTGEPPEEIVKAKGLVQVSDEAELSAVIARVLAANPDAVANYRAGKKQSLGFLVGQVMKETSGRANPGLVNRLLSERLEG